MGTTAMNFASDLTNMENTTEMAQAHSLRRYLFKRASGLKAAEYCSGGMDIEQTRALAEGLPFRKIRQDGQGWCEWLGLDTSIKDDAQLSAFWLLCAPEDADPEANYFWQRLLKECGSNRLKALRKWRILGAEAMTRAAIQRVAPLSHSELAKAKLKPIYLRRANGKKPLKTTAKPTSQRGRVREA